MNNSGSLLYEALNLPSFSPMVIGNFYDSVSNEILDGVLNIHRIGGSLSSMKNQIQEKLDNSQ